MPFGKFLPVCLRPQPQEQAYPPWATNSVLNCFTKDDAPWDDVYTMSPTFQVRQQSFSSNVPMTRGWASGFC
jgi:hypothetical protein